MREVRLGPGLRALLGVVGAAATLGGLLVGATELRIAARWWPYGPALVAAAAGGVIALGGAALVRGAVRGRIAVHRPGRRHRPGE